MFKLFQRVPKGLDPMAAIFKRHVEGDGMAQASARSALSGSSPMLRNRCYCAPVICWGGLGV